MIDLALLPDGGLGWLHASGPHSQIVLSTRIRLARNVMGHPFSQRATDAERRAVLARITDVLHPTAASFIALSAGAVYGISDVAGLLAMSFSLICLLALLAWRRAGQRRWYWLAVLACCASLLSKESQISLVLVVAAFLWWQCKDWRSVPVALLPFVAVTAGYMIFQVSSFQGRPGSQAYALLSDRSPGSLARALVFLLVPVAPVDPRSAWALSGSTIRRGSRR